MVAGALSAALTAAPVINEIHYNNDDNTVANEFVELINPGDSSVDVSGWRITGGIEYTFPENTSIAADGFLVIGEDPATLQSQFGAAAIGPYAGRLSGEGEAIELLDDQGALVDRVNYGVNFPWPTAADGGGSSMELINPSLDNNLGSSWRSSSLGSLALPPTPGDANSVASDLAAPNIRQVDHAPGQPRDSEPVVITAKVTDPEGVGSVELQYRPIAPGSYVPAYLAKSTSELHANPTSPLRSNRRYRSGWIGVPMVDDGTGDDAVAGDDIYTATLDAQPNRTLVRYRIEVTDVPGTSVTVPYADDESLNFAYYVYNGIPDFVAGTRSVTGRVPTTHSAATLGALPTYHLLTTQEDFDQCVAYNGADQVNKGNTEARSAFNWTGTFVYNGKVYDNIKYRLRQRNARYSGSGKRSFRFRFNRGRYVQFHDLEGKPYPTKWRTLNSHKMTGSRGGANFGLYEGVNSILWNLTGTPAPETHWFHFRVVKGTEEAPAGTNGQHLGDFYGLLLAMEDYDSRFLDAHKLEPGNLYKLKTGGNDGLSIQRYQARDAVSNASDFTTIINQLRPSQSNRWLDSHVNWNSYYHYHAIVDAVRHYDVSGGTSTNNGEHLKNRAYYFEPDPGNPLGKLHILPWDSDTSWGPNWNGGWDWAKTAMSNKAGYNKEYKNVVREIRDLVWQSGELYALLDHLESKLSGFSLADRDRWTNATGSPYPGSQTDGPITARVRDMKNFAFRGGSWTGGSSSMLDYVHNGSSTQLVGSASISPDSGLSGQRGRDAYLDALAHDPSIPDTPVLSDLSAPGHPVNALQFESSAFSDASGGFAAMEYRIAEVAPGDGGLMLPRLEWEADWESGELDTFAGTIAIPTAAVRSGRTYRARVRHQDNTGRWSHWSAPVEFTTTLPDLSPYLDGLVISEVMYHPGEPSAAEFAAGFTDDDAFEFIELRNVGSVALDLTDLRLTKGVDFDFLGSEITSLAPGGFVLVVANRAAFEMRYGTSLPIAGEWESGDKLDNGGEQIKLSFGAGAAIRDFSYDDEAPWPTGPDGTGVSLVLGGGVPVPDHTLSTNWRAGSAAQGTPGADELAGPFAGWLAAQGATDPDAAFGSSSLSNLLAYAVGGDITATPEAALPTGSVVEAGGTNYPALSYRVRQDATEVTYQVEVSGDLVQWQVGAGVTTGFGTPQDNGDGTVTLTVRTLAPLASQPGQYLRLRVELAP